MKLQGWMAITGLGMALGGMLAAMPLSAQDMVTVEAGQLQGVTTGGVTAFKGIPYAAPPVGNLRWRPPQPAARWSGVRSAADYGHDCMQLPFPQDAAPLRTTPAEDCLYLNVWTPAQRNGANLPVIVWIYGGGWVNGGTSPAVYDGTPFARDGVVFVSMNYRVGRFGFFAHPALTAESTDGLLGNYGYMDQIAALRWIQANISAFGGDAHNVTVFGESAGGYAIQALMTSPMARGLFQRAIIESGGGRVLASGVTPRLDQTVGNRPSAESVGMAFAATNGITSAGAAALAAMRALPAETVCNGLNMATSGAQAATYSGPMIDGRVVVGEPQDIYLAGEQMHVSVIVGANNQDLGFGRARTLDALFAEFGANAAAARTAYDPDGSGELRKLDAEVASDAMMVEPARFVAQTLSQAGQPVWEFRFGYVADSMQKEWTGATHSSEIPYVFDTVAARYGAALTAADEKMAQTAHAYWVNFAKTGDPNGPGLPEWPRYSAANDTLMDFAQTGAHAETDPWKARLDVTEALTKGSAAAAHAVPTSAH